MFVKWSWFWEWHYTPKKSTANMYNICLRVFGSLLTDPSRVKPLWRLSVSYGTAAPCSRSLDPGQKCCQSWHCQTSLVNRVNLSQKFIQIETTRHVPDLTSTVKSWDDTIKSNAFKSNCQEKNIGNTNMQIIFKYSHRFHFKWLIVQGTPGNIFQSFSFNFLVPGRTSA